MFRNGGGRFYWSRRQEAPKGIVVAFAWASVCSETQLENFASLYASLGWDSLVCLADFLNPFFPEKATSVAFALLNELVEELRIKPRALVFAAFSGGSKACMYKVLQVIEGACEVQITLDDTRLIRNCISGHIYDSSPVDFTSDIGAQFALHPTILKMPGAAKIVSSIAKGVASGLDALFITKFGSDRTEYWQALYSSVSLRAPYLILCSEDDDLAPYSAVYNFAHHLQEIGGNVEFVKWKGSPHLGHYEHCPIQYRAAVTNLLHEAVSVYSRKRHVLGERHYMEEGMHDQISELVCDLQKAAVESNQSFTRVARGPNDHFFLPSSAEYASSRESGSLQDEQKEGSVHLSNPPSMNAHSVLGKILFDACVPKNVEGWDIKFSGSLNGQPLGSARKHSSPQRGKKCIRRSRL